MKQTLSGLIAVAAVAAMLGAPVRGAAADKPSVGASPLLTLDYANAEVTDVIRALAAQSGANVAVNPGVKGLVTVHLRGKTVDEALQVVTSLAGLASKRVNDTYVVAARADMRQTLERLGVTKTVGVKHLTPQAAADLLQGALPDLTARPQGKQIALTGAPDDLEAADRLLQENDVVAPESAPATERVTLKYRQADKTAPLLAKMTPGLTAEAAGDSVVLAGTRAQVDAAKRSLAMIDTAGRPDSETRVYNVRYMAAGQLVSMLEKAVPDVQVIPGPESNGPSSIAFNPISGKFMGGGSGSGGSSGGGLASVSGGGGPTDTGSSGSTTNARTQPLTLILKGSPASLDAAMSTLEKVDVAPRQMTIEAKVVETSPSTAEEYGLHWDWSKFTFNESPAGGDARPLGFGAFSRVPWSFQAILSAMITKREATLLANPQISVLNDQDASIFIGDTLRFQALATSSATAGSQFTVVEVPVGIILLVHPRINDEGNITLRVHPVVSTVTALVDGLPQTSAREAETVVRVRDGDTLVIGGLIRDEDIKEMSKIPLLGDLPIIGHLFRNTTRSHRRSEVMVVLTIRLQK